jgi:N-hydroxyarylamine O-acetyltransferase
MTRNRAVARRRRETVAEERETRHKVDLDRYLARVGYSGVLDVTLETLRRLHFAHATSIPFENLDILLGRGVSLELGALEAKLVAGRRGGYCFEHNTLFSAVLEQLGFAVTRLAARVRMGAAQIGPRSHMLLSVTLDGEHWLADVGFGGAGPLYPIPLGPFEPAEPALWCHRVHREGNLHVLEVLQADGWLALYAFSQEPQFPVDYEVSNYYTATHASSPFVQSLIVQRRGDNVRWTLRNRELTEERPDKTLTQTIGDDDALLVILAQLFDLEFPPGTRFRQGQGSVAC